MSDFALVVNLKPNAHSDLRIVHWYPNNTVLVQCISSVV